MEYEIKFTGSQEDYQSLIQMINAHNAYDSLWKIRKLCMEAISKDEEDMDSAEYVAYLEEILDWTNVEGMF